jgi:hypothetical protein
MKFINLLWALNYKRIPHFQVAGILKITLAMFSMKMTGRAEFAPHERARISEFLAFDQAWLFEEFSPPQSAWVRPDRPAEARA